MTVARPRRRPDRTAALAAAIIDFRDEDDIPGVNGLALYLAANNIAARGYDYA
jgi:hypothetical protein